MKTAEREVSHSEAQAIAQLESIKEMIAALDGDDNENAQETIQQDPLSVEVREPWHAPGESPKPDEFCILLCTGGPAVRIVGDLDEDGQPYRPRLQHQDWGTPWTEYFPDELGREALLDYCRCFYFGE